MDLSKYCLVIFLLLSKSSFAQLQQGNSYDDIRSNYENLSKNDIRALPYVNHYIKRAKKDSDFKKLTQGYRDAVFFSPASRNKLIYSDSMICAALKSKDNDLATLAYLGKGIIYYFNYKKYEPSLNEYLKAFEYSKKSENPYLKHKVIYHLGVVKSYLGYYEDAIGHFNSSIAFFESEANRKNNHPNEIFNNKRGYYNSLHQMVVCYRQLNRTKVADSLIASGLLKINGEKDFLLEKSYLLKCRGISSFNKHNYEGAVVDLTNALPELAAKDFAWASMVYFYLGKSYRHLDSDKSLPYFKKVDSVFEKHHFILPELRENYEILIKHFKTEKDFEKELYYTNQLLSVDSTIAKDFSYLSSRIHKEYDQKTLLDQKQILENKVSHWKIVVVVLIVVSFAVIVLFIVRYRNEKKIKLNYLLLQDKLNAVPDAQKTDNEQCPKENRKSELSEEIMMEIAKNIALFEEKKGFTKKGLSLAELASKIGTNTSYLSIYINEKKGENFKNYLNKLRIAYITELLNSKSKYLNYTVDALATECGIATRQSFSDLFYEFNGIRPKDYIAKRKDDLLRK